MMDTANTSDAMDDHTTTVDTAMFDEPLDFRPPTPPPTVHIVPRRPLRFFQRQWADHADQDDDGDRASPLHVTLVGHHSLWSHCLWNAGVVLGEWLDAQPQLVRDRCVVELGAAAAVPSLIAALRGARCVVASEYPDARLLAAIRANVDRNAPAALADGHIHVEGFLWGTDAAPLLAYVRPAAGFDLVVLADLVFNHSEHHNLLRSALALLREGADNEAYTPQILVSYTSHRPWLAEKDAAFFTIAAGPPYHLHVEQIFCVKTDPMFPNDPGDIDVRSTVTAFRLTRPSAHGR